MRSSDWMTDAPAGIVMVAGTVDSDQAYTRRA